MTTNTTNADDGTDAQTDDHFDPEAETVTDAWEGAFLYTSWGYGQTNADFAQIVDVSDSGKTVVARMCKANLQDVSHGNESVSPNAECYGDEFRLHVRNFRGDPWFRGSYPFVDGDMENGKRRDSFRPYTKGDEGVYQTAPNHGH